MHMLHDLEGKKLVWPYELCRMSFLTQLGGEWEVVDVIKKSRHYTDYAIQLTIFDETTYAGMRVAESGAEYYLGIMYDRRSGESLRLRRKIDDAIAKHVQEKETEGALEGDGTALANGFPGVCTCFRYLFFFCFLFQVGRLVLWPGRYSLAYAVCFLLLYVIVRRIHTNLLR